jgi:hypothetical protein
MHTPHVVIDSLTARECLKAYPTDVRLALCARHVVASLRTLDRNFTTGTVFDVMVLHPLLEQTVFALWTCKTVVCFYMAI